MRAPSGAGREVAPDESSRADSKSVAQTVDTNEVTALRVGQSVRVNDDVRPLSSERSGVGTVVTINEGEIGLNLGSSKLAQRPRHGSGLMS